MVCNLIVTLLITLTSGQQGIQQGGINKADLPKLQAELTSDATKAKMKEQGVQSVEIFSADEVPDFNCETGEPL
jgi:hypothetical protein